MNIKITIKDADTPLLFHKNELSEVESKKKNALYKQPEKKTATLKNDKNVSMQQKPVRDIKDDKNMRRTGFKSEIEEEQYAQAEKKMMQDLDKISKNQASLDMIHNSNNILRKQNEILQQNQKTIYSMAANNQTAARNNEQAREQEKLLGQIKKEVDQMRKIKEEIEKAGKEFARSLNQTGKTPNRQAALQEMPQNVAEMNNNLQNLAQISKNQLQGLQNMQGIKSLQNFNIEGYSQAINGLKRQIMQYQKQSQQIERELKLRAAKLQKLQINPNFDEQLLVPYQNYLKKRADAIDLHAIKEKTYEKLGHFDYSKFQFDSSQIMAEVKNQMNEFNIICKQYRVQVPEIKIDQRELKGLDLKLPSAIDQYKAERGIYFNKPSNTNQNVFASQELGQSRQRKPRKKGEPVLSMKQSQGNLKSQKLPQAIRELNSKPVDFTTQVKFQKTNEPTQKTVLQNERQRQKKSVQANFKKGKIAKEDAQFEKYLEYRAREELELLYKEKQERLQKKQRELYQFCKDEPEVYLNLDLKNEVRRQRSLEPKKKQENAKPSPKKESKEEERSEIEQTEKIPQLKPIIGTEGQAIKSVGTQILKEKLKNLLGGQQIPKRQPESYQQNFQQNITAPEFKMENVAGNFLSLINNTLTQVNNQLSRTIQHKFQNKSLSKQKKETFRRSPPKLVIPTLQEFRPPPTFNLPSYPIEPDRRAYPQGSPLVQPSKPRIEKKIVEKNYQHLKISEQDDKYQDLQISNSEDYDEDFQS